MTGLHPSRPATEHESRPVTNDHTTAPAVIRPPGPDDFDQLTRLAPMAVGHSFSAEVREALRHLCSTGGRGVDQMTGTRGPRREPMTVSILHRVTVADRRGKAVGMTYVGNPISWTNMLAGWPTSDLTAMVPLLNEIQMLAVEPRHRRQGIAGLLLDETEAHLRATGHRLAMVCLSNNGNYPALAAWYRRRGYTFGPGDRAAVDPADDATWRPWRIQPRTGGDTFDFYRATMPGLGIAFKSLHPAVTVTPATDTDPATVTGLLDQE